MSRRHALTRAPVGRRALDGRITPATLPPGFIESAVATGFFAATTFELAPDGKLFVSEQGGTLEVWQNGTRVQENFFRDAPLTVSSVGERGLLGVAFDPNYASNRFVYVYYTATTPAIHNRVSRFTATAAGDLAVAGSERVVIDLDDVGAFSNHNGGALHFGPDGKLYVAAGDAGTAENAQQLTNVFGKLLRLNADGSIPADNPFAGTATGNNRAIWAYGLRNPFTFAFQPGAGRLFINDVGQGSWEEINVGRRGGNYGWPVVEGPAEDARFAQPLYAYPHDGAGVTGQSIVGAAFYNPAVNTFGPDYAGDYFFADFVAGWIKRLDLATNTVSDFAADTMFPVDLRVAADGSLYYLSRALGRVYRVTPAPTVTLRTYSPGLQLLLDGQAVTTPTTFQAEAGVTRRLEAPASQTVNGRVYFFHRWSDGVTDRVRDVGLPAADVAYEAEYRYRKVAVRR